MKISADFRDAIGNSRPVIEYSVSDYTGKGLVEARRVAGKIFEQIGNDDKIVYDKCHPNYFDYDGEGYQFEGPGHTAGTHCIGNSRHNSVVDPNLSTWDHENLYLVSCGSFCTIGTTNPTLTPCGARIQGIRAKTRSTALNLSANSKCRSRVRHPLREFSKNLEMRRTELLSHLAVALQLEHATNSPYLFALYSIRDPQDQNRAAAQVLRSMLLEEMLHMVLVSNLINAIHSEAKSCLIVDELDLRRSDFVPRYPDRLPGSDAMIVVKLLPFSQEAIEVFLAIEKPAPADTIPIQHGQNEPIRYGSTGEFYATFKQELDDICEDFDEAAIFRGDPTRQITPNYYYNGGGEVVVVNDYASARRALKVIVDQGEGFNRSIFSGDHENFDEAKDLAHSFKFKQIAAGRYYRPTDSPADDPTGAAFPVAFGAGAVNHARAAVHPDQAVNARVEVLHEAYRALLGKCRDGFNGRPEKLIGAVQHMRAIEHGMRSLVQIPFGENGFTVGPTFTILGIEQIHVHTLPSSEPS